jgi:hypothetical protein
MEAREIIEPARARMAPNLTAPQSSDGDSGDPVCTRTMAESDHVYIDTNP